MSFEIKVFSEAENCLEKMHMTNQKEIRKALHQLKNNSELGKPLVDKLIGLRSMRVGKYRIVYNVDKKKSIIYVRGIGHRKEIYKINYG